jgi:DNA-binding transcriptional LysR family regulator
MRRLPEDGDLVARRVARVAHAVYAVSAGVATVIGLPDPERRPSQAAWLEGWAAGRPVPLRLGDVALRHQAARQGIGATLLPCWLGDGDPALVRLAPPPRELQEDVYLLVRRDARGEARLDRLVRGLVALFRTRAEALAG